MEETGDQLDFNDELNNFDIKKVSQWRHFFIQIGKTSDYDVISSHTIFANITAWCYRLLTSVSADLKIAIEEGGYSSPDCTKLKLAMETYSVADWQNQHENLHNEANQFGELEPLRTLINRHAFAERIISYTNIYWDEENLIVNDVRERNERLFDLEIKSQRKIYYPNEEQIIAEKRRSKKEYLRQIKLRELDKKAKDLAYEREKKSEFGVGMFFGIVIGVFLTTILFGIAAGMGY